MSGVFMAVWLVPLLVCGLVALVVRRALMALVAVLAGAAAVWVGTLFPEVSEDIGALFFWGGGAMAVAGVCLAIFLWIVPDAGVAGRLVVAMGPVAVLAAAATYAINTVPMS